MVPINYYIILSAILFTIGVVGCAHPPQCSHHLYVR